MAHLLLDILGKKKAIIGVVHLLPLPGSPLYGGCLDTVSKRAIKDAMALEKGGADAFILENYGDLPFRKAPVGPETVASMTSIAKDIGRVCKLPFGVNVLRNDPKAALAVAHASGAVFIRVNVHTGVAVCDQGLIEGEAFRTLNYRKMLGDDTKVAILSDCLVKHARPLQATDIGNAAKECVLRGRADGVIITGDETGKPPEVVSVSSALAAVGDVPIFVGSGVCERNIRKFLEHANGIIVGSSVKVEGITNNPVDEAKVAELVRAAGL